MRARSAAKPVGAGVLRQGNQLVYGRAIIPKAIGCKAQEGPPDMDTHQLALFKEVYECGSMSKAAKRLFITPQGFSRSIAALEAELGQQLFDRTNHGVTPTAYARELYPKACKIVQLADSIKHGAQGGPSREVIEIASVSGGLSFFGSALADDFAATHPGLELSIIERNDRQAAELVRTGTVECGVVAGPVDRSMFDSTLVAQHPHAVVVRADSDLAALRAVSFSDLKNRPVGMMGEGFSPFEYVRERLEREEVRPAKVVGFAEGYTGIVRARRGDLCFITVDFLIPPSSDPGLAVLPFDDPQFTWDEHFIVRRGSQPDAGVLALRNHIASWLRDHETSLFPWRSDSGPWPLSGSRIQNV